MVNSCWVVVIPNQYGKNTADSKVFDILIMYIIVYGSWIWGWAVYRYLVEILYSFLYHHSLDTCSWLCHLFAHNVNDKLIWISFIIAISGRSDISQTLLYREKSTPLKLEVRVYKMSSCNTIYIILVIVSKEPH